MILFPDCKINIGLDVLGKRPDGYHEIETLMFPVGGLCDVLEIIPSDIDGVRFTCSGIAVDCPPERNLCIKAYNLIACRFDIGGVAMHLHKAIPFGAGLGGGSSDAAFAIKGLSEVFSLGLDVAQMESLAAELGSDTAFFIRDIPQICSGRGEVLEPYELDINGRMLLIVKPPVNIPTSEAYAGIVPVVPRTPLRERLAGDMANYRENVGNAFEKHLFEAHPVLHAVKKAMYEAGAEYASMSGSGSALFGIFPEGYAPDATHLECLLKGFAKSEQGDFCVDSNWFIYSEIIGDTRSGRSFDAGLFLEKNY